MVLTVGDKIPSFTAKDEYNETFNCADLIGSPFVIYFYPKDDTPGCTIEACSFRDNIEHLDNLDTVVIGVSPDSPESHQKFIHKHELNFTLLCDEKLDLATKFGAVEDANGIKKIVRSTFLVDGEGILRWLEKPVNVTGHTDRVIKAIQTLPT